MQISGKSLYHYSSILISTLIFILGASALMGWIFHMPRLVSISSFFPPMVFNTALSFVITGSAFLSLKRFPRLALCLSFLLFILSMATLCELVFVINLGIDEFFVKDNITLHTIYPGRMAINTTLCFLLTSVILLMQLLLRSIYSYAKILQFLLAMQIGAIGLLCILGYLAGVTAAYGWFSLTQMAPNTGLGFILASVNAILIFWTESKHALLKERGVVLPLIVLVLGTTIFLFLWQAIITHIHQNIRSDLDSHGQLYGVKVLLNLRTEYTAINRVQDPPEFDVDTWASHTKELKKSYAEVVASVYGIDETNPAIIAVSKFNDKDVMNLIQQCKKQHRDPVINNTDRVYIIKAKDNYYACFINKLINRATIVDLKTIFNKSVLPSLPKKVFLSINDVSTKQVLYQAGIDDPDSHLKVLQLETPITVFGSRWIINQWPSIKYIHSYLAWPPRIFILFGITITILLSAVIYMWQIVKHNNRFLEIEVARRTQELKISEERYQMLFENAANMYVIVSLATQKIIDCNGALVRTLNYKAKKELLGQSLLVICHPDSDSIMKSAFHKLKNSNEANIELELKKHDGSRLAAALQMILFKDADEKASSIICDLRSI